MAILLNGPSVDYCGKSIGTLYFGLQYSTGSPLQIVRILVKPGSLDLRRIYTWRGLTIILRVSCFPSLMLCLNLPQICFLKAKLSIWLPRILLYATVLLQYSRCGVATMATGWSRDLGDFVMCPLFIGLFLFPGGVYYYLNVVQA